jgi:hypothetical protein
VPKDQRTRRTETQRVRAQRTRALRVVLFVLSLAFILAGGYRGEIRTVFIKASRVCLECIGIG